MCLAVVLLQDQYIFVGKWRSKNTYPNKQIWYKSHMSRYNHQSIQFVDQAKMEKNILVAFNQFLKLPAIGILKKL